MKSLDTNLVVRFLLGDQPEQKQMITLLIDEAPPGGLAVADVVFFECVWVLTGDLYRFNRPLVAKLLGQFLKIPEINCNRQLFERALSLYAQHTGISFSDVCLVTYAELNDSLPLITFDKKLAKALPKQVDLLE